MGSREIIRRKQVPGAKRAMGYGYGCRGALRAFGIDLSQLDTMSLLEIKQQARRGYKERLYEVHPDTGGRKYLYLYNHNGGTFVDVKKLKSWYEKVSNLKYKPLTVANCDKVLELDKGYKTAEDVDLGLNGFI